jgi:hypothetical protein
MIFMKIYGLFFEFLRSSAHPFKNSLNKESQLWWSFKRKTNRTALHAISRCLKENFNS